MVRVAEVESGGASLEAAREATCGREVRALDADDACLAAVDLARRRLDRM